MPTDSATLDPPIPDPSILDQSTLGPNQVHVWAVRTDPFASPESLPIFREILSRDEQRIAERFRTPALTERYVVSHALLRHVLGRYVGARPKELRITTDRNGRPLLPDYPETDFNLSHTEGMSAVAVARVTVGVDIERLRDDVDARAISKRVCSNAERATISADMAPSRTPFFDYWTIKEAYAKATGLGVRVPFRDIDVSLDDALRVDLQAVDDDAGRWMFELHGCDRFRLAVVARRERAGDADIRLIEVDGRLQPVGPLAMTRLGSTQGA